MLQKIAAVDMWLLEKVVEPLSWWFESTTGYNNFQQARAVLMAYFVATCAFWFVDGEPNYVSIIVGVLIAIGLYIYSLDIQSRSRDRTMNPARGDWLNYAIRIYSVAELLGNTYFAVQTAGIISNTPFDSDEQQRLHSALHMMLLLWYISGITGLLFSYLLMCSRPPLEYSRQVIRQTAT